MAESWFRHDTDARNDIKLRKLARDHGLAGIGAFWVAVEVLYGKGGEADEATLRDELDFIAPPGMLDVLADYGLVQINDGMVTSHRVESEIEYQEMCRKKLSDAGRAAANARWNKVDATACDRIQTHTDECDPMRIDTIHATIPNHTNKKDISPTKVGSIQKEAKFTPPSLQEIADYCKERKNNVDPQKVYDYYSSGDWKDQSGKPVRNWKQKIIAVWEKDGKGSGTVASRKKMTTDPEIRGRYVNEDGSLNLFGGRA